MYLIYKNSVIAILRLYWFLVYALINTCNIMQYLYSYIPTVYIEIIYCIICLCIYKHNFWNFYTDEHILNLYMYVCDSTSKRLWSSKCLSLHLGC